MISSAFPDIEVQKERDMPKEICDLSVGNTFEDGGNFLIDETDFSKLDPAAQKYAREFWDEGRLFNGVRKRCLWLVGSKREEREKSPFIMDRIDKVRHYRNENAMDASLPWLPCGIRQPKTSYVAFPKKCKGTHPYMLCAYLEENAIPSDGIYICQDSDGLIFATIESSMFRIFPQLIKQGAEDLHAFSIHLWNCIILPEFSQEMKSSLSEMGKAILGVRRKYADEPLSSLYSSQMPEDLRCVHKELDYAMDVAITGRSCRNDRERKKMLRKAYLEQSA